MIHPKKRDPVATLGRPRPIWPTVLLALLLTCPLWRTLPVFSQEDFPPSPSPVPNSSPAIHRPSFAAEQLRQDRPITSLRASIKPPLGDLPPNFAGPVIDEVGVLFDAIDDTRQWLVMKPFEWDAPATRHLPLLFEEPNLERAGYTHRTYIDAIGYETDPVVAEYLQPVVSGAHFFGHALSLPYFLGVQNPCEPIYTLGVDRPGSPVWYRRHNIPLSAKGAIFQAGVVCALVFAIP